MRRATAKINENGEVKFELSKVNHTYSPGIVEITCQHTKILEKVKSEIETKYPSLIPQYGSNDFNHPGRLRYKESSQIDSTLGIDSTLCTNKLSIINRASDSDEQASAIVRIVKQFLEADCG